MHLKIISQSLTITAINQRHLDRPIFHPDVIQREREKSKEQTTIVFDLDATLAWHHDNERGYLVRPGIEEQLKELVKKKVRLVLWTNNTRLGTTKFFMQHPHLFPLFDLIITAENVNLWLTNSNVIQGEFANKLKELFSKGVKNILKDIKKIKGLKDQDYLRMKECLRVQALDSLYYVISKNPSSFKNDREVFLAFLTIVVEKLESILDTLDYNEKQKLMSILTDFTFHAANNIFEGIHSTKNIALISQNLQQHEIFKNHINQAYNHNQGFEFFIQHPRDISLLGYHLICDDISRGTTLKYSMIGGNTVYTISPWEGHYADGTEVLISPLEQEDPEDVSCLAEMLFFLSSTAYS
jgi:hypothetical protein